MTVALAEPEEGYDSMPELEFGSEFGVRIPSETELQLWRGDNLGEGAHVRRFLILFNFEFKILFKFWASKEREVLERKGGAGKSVLKMKSMTSPS